MKPLHYLIFHPDYARKKTEVQAKVLMDDKLTDWQGNVWVDEPCGNEDPFVFSERWLYSYCHATQLRRKPISKSSHVTAGSYIFFCSGDAANENTIQLDTVFVVDHSAKWPDNQHGIPEEFQQDYKNNKSERWERHFKYSFLGQHTGKYTYVSRQWFDSKDEYSFLPISQNGDRVEFNLGLLTSNIQSKIKDKVNGKYPVTLSEEQKTELLKIALSLASIKVIGNLKRQDNNIKTINPGNISCGSKLLKFGKC
ncbi:hypothetical protein CDG76_34155 [Nostoc sp. 'Peltigera membranacea cyanobiont' 210A]|uniref:hypothetical protein n=1 Tax=Nostoc sp. 'Peltigera membranacea cyanobiont' 210A TaxID=2014529 RepID=UPI000B952F50|nr:hypothetical protein [Nostoc sp. 'Peltigera membranacea cyanobiont' 210A]OYD89636.1 hypothetical protein CDG76_34155 [Nostoc sp. 'Peltigera membranacea cyanobiont' 210A]